MKRDIFQSLIAWSKKPQRKPLILRGARQVGKTHLVKQLGKTFKRFVMINFEKQPKAAEVFVAEPSSASASEAKNLDPKRIVRDLSLMFDVKIIPQETLLFFDEIQQVPQAITALRYFYEDYPELHVIAAGSLLDFAIEQVGVPVGRVEFLYIYPMSLMEFLMATDRGQAAEAILNQPFSQPFSSAVHERFLDYVTEYLAVGGMPEVVETWRETGDLEQCNIVKHNLIDAYRQDFEKYSKKRQIKYVNLLFNQVPHRLGEKFKFSKIPGKYRKRELAPSLDLLTKAQVVKPICHSSGQGLPLAAQANFAVFKTLFIDVALAQTVLGYFPKEWLLQGKQNLINQGKIVESFVGQELLAYSNPHIQSSLYYWQREERGSNAEVDYLIERQGQIVPVEVKSGSGTMLKSMHRFLESHPHSSYGVRCSLLPASQEGKILSYPLYAVAALKGFRRIEFAR